MYISFIAVNLLTCRVLLIFRPKPVTFSSMQCFGRTCYSWITFPKRCYVESVHILIYSLYFLWTLLERTALQLGTLFALQLQYGMLSSAVTLHSPTSPFLNNKNTACSYTLHCVLISIDQYSVHFMFNCHSVRLVLAMVVISYKFRISCVYATLWAWVTTALLQFYYAWWGGDEFLNPINLCLPDDQIGFLIALHDVNSS